MIERFCDSLSIAADKQSSSRRDHSRWVETRMSVVRSPASGSPCRRSQIRTTSRTTTACLLSVHLKAGCLQSIHILPAPSILAQSLKNSIHTIAAVLLLTISVAANAQEQDLHR